MEKFEDKLKAADKFLTGKGEGKFRIFYQEEDGVLTGDLVKVYTKKYLDTKSDLINKATYTRKAADWKKFKEWSKENEEYLDIRLLFPERELNDTQKETAESHKKHIISLVGERQFNKMMSEIESAIEDFNYAKSHKLLELETNPNLSESDVNSAMLE